MPTRIMTLVTLTPAQSRSNYVPNGEFFTAHDGERYQRNIEVQYMHKATRKRADGYMVISHEGEVLGYVSLGPDGRGTGNESFRRVRAAYGHSGNDDGGYSAADRKTQAEMVPVNGEIHFLDSVCRSEAKTRWRCLLGAGFIVAKPAKTSVEYATDTGPVAGSFRRLG